MSATASEEQHCKAACLEFLACFLPSLTVDERGNAALWSCLIEVDLCPLSHGIPGRAGTEVLK